MRPAPAHLFPVVLAGPSGGGKTTVRGALLSRRSDLRFSVSATTRAARPGEVDGRDYQFLDRASFERLIEAGELLEWAQVHGDLYGTPRSNLRGAWDDGLHLLLDIDVQGARQLRAVQPDAVTIFLLPPSYELLVERLRNRGSEDRSSFRKRMRSALAELAEVERFDYMVVNENLEDTVRDVESVISAERHRMRRLTPDVMQVVRDLSDSLNGMLSASDEQEARNV